MNEKEKAKTTLANFIDWFAPTKEIRDKALKTLDELTAPESKGNRNTILNMPHCRAE